MQILIDGKISTVMRLLTASVDIIVSGNFFQKVDDLWLSSSDKCTLLCMDSKLIFQSTKFL